VRSLGVLQVCLPCEIIHDNGASADVWPSQIRMLQCW